MLKQIIESEFLSSKFKHFHHKCRPSGIGNCRDSIRYHSKFSLFSRSTFIKIYRKLFLEKGKTVVLPFLKMWAESNVLPCHKLVSECLYYKLFASLIFLKSNFTGDNKPGWPIPGYLAIAKPAHLYYWQLNVQME